MKIDKLHPKEDTPELFMNERIIYLQPTVRLKNNFFDGTKNEEKKIPRYAHVIMLSLSLRY